MADTRAITNHTQPNHVEQHRLAKVDSPERTKNTGKRGLDISDTGTGTGAGNRNKLDGRAASTSRRDRSIAASAGFRGIPGDGPSNCNTAQHQEVKSFDFEGNAVRVILRDGDPWFVASDLCMALNLTNSRVALKALDDEEKDVSSTYTLGGQQKLAIVSEGGMWTLVLRCRDAVTPGTIPFRVRKWVTSEVLPSIRKTGQYTLPSTINPEQAQHLKELVQLVAESGKQGYSETWARLHRKFKVNSYLQLRPDQFTEACLYLNGKMDAESIGNLIAKHIDISTLERLAPQSNMDQVLLAMRTANELAASVQEHMFKKLVRSEASPLADRWVLSFNSGSHGLQPMTSTIERESFIATPSTFADMVAKSEANLTNEELAKIASACSQKLARRMTQTTALLGA